MKIQGGRCNIQVEDYTDISYEIKLGSNRAIWVNVAAKHTASSLKAEEYSIGDVLIDINKVCELREPDRAELMDFFLNYQLAEDNKDEIANCMGIITLTNLQQLRDEPPNEQGVNQDYEETKEKIDDGELTLIQDEEWNNIKTLGDFAGFIKGDKELIIFITLNFNFNGETGNDVGTGNVVADAVADIEITEFNATYGENYVDLHTSSDVNDYTPICPVYVAKDEWKWFYNAFMNSDDNIKGDITENIKYKLFDDKDADYIAQLKEQYEDNNDGKKWSKLPKQDKIDFALDNLKDNDWSNAADDYWQMFRDEWSK